MLPSRSTALALALFVVLGGAAQTAAAIALGQEHRTSMRASATGTVTAVDAAARQLTVRGPRGEAAYRVDPKVQGLDAVKVGDAVRVTYVAGVGLTLRRGAREVAESGAPAGQVVGKQAKVITRVAAVDPSRGTLRLKTAQGSTSDYPVADKADLAGVRVGDQVEVVVYELVAVEVAPAKK